MRVAGEPGSSVDPASLGPCGAEFAERLRAFAEGVIAEFALGRDHACVVTFSAGYVDDLFDDVFALVETSPILEGWEFHALRPRRTPERFEAFGIACDLKDLRFSYRLGSDRIVIALLADETAAGDYRIRRAFAAELVAELLGEEDYGRYVSDVLMLDYETWLAATPGGRSAPLSVLGPTFDRIFRRPQSLRRPIVGNRLRLVG
ncbi:MAG: hypothetical protein ACK4MV_08980 [Beijerinckiaceae bacterium]